MINGEECEIFAYGITLILPYYLECLIIIIISITFDSVRSSIVYIITFTMIRDYVGGYHAKNRIKCAILYIFNYLLIIFVSKLIVYSVYLNVLFFASNILLLIIKPVRLTSKKFYYMSIYENRFNLLLIIFIEMIFNHYLISINSFYLSSILILSNFCVLFYLIIQIFINIKR